jgi:hypothetical protein
VAWLIPLVFVNKKHMFSYSAIFIFYIGAVWLRLEGTIDGGKGAPDQAYAIATIGLWGACAWLMVQCVDIMRIQGRDTVRQSLARYARENDSHYAE